MIKQIINSNYYYMAQPTNFTVGKLLYSLIITILVYVGQSVGSLSLSLTSPTINTNSIYQFQIVDPNLLNFDGVISIIFPQSLFTISSVSTYNTDDNTQVYSHSLPNAYTVTITYNRPSPASQILRISIQLITNPPSQQSLQFQYLFEDSGGSEINSITDNQSPYTPGDLQSCTITMSPSLTHTEAVATLDITIGNGLPQDSSITLTFPTTWENSVSDTYSPVIYSSTTCSKISGTSLSSSLSCSILSLPSSDQVAIDQAFSSAISASESFSFSLTGILAPATISANNQITVTTEQASTGNLVDQSTCSVTAVSTQSLSLSTTSAFTVGVQQYLQISWTTAFPITIGDIITITLPSDYLQFIDTNAVVIFYNSNVASVSVSSGSSALQKKITLTSLQSGTQITDGSVLNLTGLYVNNLIDSSPRDITLQISRNGFSIADGTLAVTPSPNALISPSISTDVTGVSKALEMQISFTTTSSLLSDASIEITFPNDMEIIGSPTCEITSTDLPSLVNPSPACTISGYQLSVPAFLNNQIPSNTQITLTILNLLGNPITTQTTSVFVISTFSNGGYAIDQDTSLSYTATPQTIGNITITPASLVVADEIAYTITYGVINTLKAGSIINIQIPSQLSFSSSPSYVYSIDSGSQITTSPSLNGSILTFSNIISSQLGSGRRIDIIITNIQNPLSLKPSSSFSIETYYSTFLTQSLTTGLIITPTTMNSFNQFTPVVTGPTNGAQQIYSFFFNSPVQLTANDRIQLQLLTGTNQLSFSSTIDVCSFDNTTVTLTNVCTLSNKILTITLTGSVTANLQYRLVVSSIVLGRTPQTSPDFQFTSYTFDGYGISQSTVTPTTNTLPNNLVSLSLDITTSPSLLNQIQQFSISIETFNHLQSGDYLVIFLPSIYEYIGTFPATSSLCSNANLTCSHYESDSLAIKVQGTFGTHTLFDVSILIGLYVSPKSFSFTGSHILVNTYTSAQLQIDQTDVTVTPVTFYLDCEGKCETCLPTNTSSCSTCYELGTGYDTSVTYDGYLYLSSDNLCLDACGDEYFNNSGICQRCTSPCQTCENNGTDCKSCVSGYFFYTLTGSCVLQCPTSTYADSSNFCSDCSSTCLQCSGTAITCTACSSSTYLYQSDCVSTCTHGFYENNSLNQCTACDVSCNGCLTAADECQNCASSYYQVVNTTVCLSNCPAGTVNDDVSGTCTCSSECQQCSGTLTNCTSCSGSFLLYQNSCLISCPGGSYQEVGGTNCLTCSDSNCIDCDDSECFKCATSYYLYSGSCLSSCPSGSIAVNKICELCNTGCSSCVTVSICTACYDTYLLQESSCVTTCSSSKVSFNATSCLSQCPSGYTNTSGNCQINSDTTDNTINTTVTDYSKIIPFPYIITYSVVACISLGMKFMFQFTLFAATLMSLGSLVEVASIWTLIIVGIINTETVTSLSQGMLCLIIGLALIYICNIVNIIMVVLYLQKDDKFSLTYNKTKSTNIFIRIIAGIFYLKFHQIVFSNLCGVRALRNKVQYTSSLFPINILIVISVFLSALIVVGASLISYNIQDQLLANPTFIQSVDCIIVVVLNVIPTILVLRRSEKDYTDEVFDGDIKRYQTTDQLNLNQDQVNGMEEVFVQESGVNYANQTKSGLSRKNYFYSSSKIVKNSQDQFETPLNKKLTGTLPIGSGNRGGQQGSEVMLVGNNGSMENANYRTNTVNEVGQEDLEEIMLQQPVKDNLQNVDGLGRHDSPVKLSSSTKYEGYDLDPKYLELPQNSEQFKKLSPQMRSKIRLAKANKHIKRNSFPQNINQEDQIDIQQIQLSPSKKNEKENKNSPGKSDKDRSLSKGRSGSKGKSGERGRIHQKGRADETQKSGSKGKSRSKGKTKRKVNGEEEEVEGNDSPINNKLSRNHSEQINKNKFKKNNKTKSQNMKNLKKNGDHMNVVYDNNEERKRYSQTQEVEEDEPQIPKFRSNMKGKYITDTDDFELEEKKSRGNSNEKDKSKNKRRRNKSIQYNSKDEDNKDNTIQDQKPDNLPQLFSSEQIKIINKKNKNRQNGNDKSGDIQMIYDDESIFRKIYNEDTETLKSAHGQNSFTNEISPSHFNVQNQRFSEVQEDTDAPIRPIINEYDIKDDGLDDQPYIPRYNSNGNLDYDSVVTRNQNDNRIKQLEKIYLPRLEVRPPKKKK